MTETRKLTTILAADVAGYSKLIGADEEGTVSRLRALRQELIDPVIATSGGRIVKTTGDGILIEFGSVVNAVRGAMEVQRGMAMRNANIGPDKRIEFRVGVHLGDVMVERDGDLMGDGVNIAARLEGICEPGEIRLSGAAYEQVRDKIAADFSDLGDKELKNISRRVRVFGIAPSRTATLSTGSTPVTAAQSKPRLSIVVLPFANIGGDLEQEYFVDGVTESLTTDLSRVSGSFVIARNTAFTYKGKPIDVKQVGRELNVRYVLEGSVQRSVNRLRINVQLIDTQTGNHLWAERFDKPVADLFDMQDEIVARLARQLDTELIAAEAQRAERLPNPHSMDLYFQGKAQFNKGGAAAYRTQALGFFERALALDPENVDALVGLAAVNVSMGANALADDFDAHYVAAEAALTLALSRAPHHAYGHFVLGCLYIQTKRAEQGIAEFEHALALDRNLAPAHGQIGLAKVYLGRFDETEGHIVEALRLSPRDSSAFIWMHCVALAKLGLGKDEEAVAWYRRSIELNRNYFIAHCYLAAALLNLGKHDEARASAKVAIALNPGISISLLRRVARTATDDPTVLAHLERILDSLRKVGVPEQ